MRHYEHELKPQLFFTNVWDFKGCFTSKQISTKTYHVNCWRFLGSIVKYLYLFKYIWIWTDNDNQFFFITKQKKTVLWRYLFCRLSFLFWHIFKRLAALIIHTWTSSSFKAHCSWWCILLLYVWKLYFWTLVSPSQMSLLIMLQIWNILGTRPTLITWADWYLPTKTHLHSDK